MMDSGRAPSIMAVIFARGGSKGIPRKALRTLGDRPVIAYSIADALAVEGNARVCVSTDDPEIREVSLACGAEAPFLRPAELAGDKSDLQDALLHVRDWYLKEEGFVWDIELVMSPTYPFRRKNLINNALRHGLEHEHLHNICSAAPVPDQLGQYFREENGVARAYFNAAQRALGSSEYFRIAMSFNIVYNYRKNVVLRRTLWPLLPVEGIDLDEPEDLELARAVVAGGWYPVHE